MAKTKCRIKPAKVVGQFQRMSRDRQDMTVVALAAYRHALSTGLAGVVARGGNGWLPNAPGWAEFKRRHGMGARPWVRTGRTLASVSHNAPVMLGKSGGLRFGVNWKSLRAFAIPETFRDGKGKMLGRDGQGRVRTVLQFGSGRERLGRYVDSGVGRTRRKRWYHRHTSHDVAVEKLAGLVARGNVAVPARPLMVWDAGWFPAMERDVAVAVLRVMRRAGFEVKR